jgi:hypothetical protein
VRKRSACAPLEAEARASAEDAFDRADARHVTMAPLKDTPDRSRANVHVAVVEAFQNAARRQNLIHQPRRCRRSEPVRTPAAVAQAVPAFLMKSLQPLRQPGAVPVDAFADFGERHAAQVPPDRLATAAHFVGRPFEARGHVKTTGKKLAIRPQGYGSKQFPERPCLQYIDYHFYTAMPGLPVRWRPEVAGSVRRGRADWPGHAAFAGSNRF